MVRRRMASPKPSPPVHRRTSPAMSARSASPTPMQTSAPTMPGATPHAQFGMAPQSRGPGLMGQMAATAGGVAIGSAVVGYLSYFYFAGNKSHLVRKAIVYAFSGSCSR